MGANEGRSGRREPDGTWLARTGHLPPPSHTTEFARSSTMRASFLTESEPVGSTRAAVL